MTLDEYYKKVTEAIDAEIDEGGHKSRNFIEGLEHALLIVNTVKEIGEW